MRIKKLDIYGYGKWIDTSFEISEAIHIFYGANEAGKSTLMSFIHSILFGFPTRNSTLLRYEPRESSRYGGRIIVEDKRFGEAIIERVNKGKVTGDVKVTLEDGTTGTDELLDSILHGLDRNMFQNIFSFSLTDIENVHQLNKNQLSRYLLNVGAHGSDRYLRIADDFNKEADTLYKPSGRVPALNKQIANLEDKEAKLVKLEEKNEQYLNWVEQLHTTKAEIEKLEKRQTRDKKRLEDLKEFKKKWRTLEEIKRLEKQIQETKLPPLKEDGRYLLEEYNHEIAEVSTQISRTQRELEQLKSSVENIDLIEKIEDNKDKISHLENELPEIVERLNAYENIEEKRAVNQRELTALEMDLEMGDLPDYPTVVSEAERQKSYTWYEEYKKTADQKQNLAAEEIQLKNEINLKNQQLDQLETVMWDDNRMSQVEYDLQKQDTLKGQAGRKFGNTLWLMGTGLIGIVLMASTFMIEMENPWIFGLIGLITLLLSGLAIWRDQSKGNQQSGASSTLMKEEYAKQQTFKENWRTTLLEIDQIQATYQNMSQRLEQLAAKEQAILLNWEKLLSEHKLPTTFALEDAAQIFTHLDRLHEVLADDEELSKQQAELRNYLNEKIHLMSEVMDLQDQQTTSEQIRQFRNYLMRIKAERRAAEDTVERLNKYKRQLKEQNSRLEHTKEKSAHLLEAVGVETEEEYLKLYDKSDKLKAAKSRVAFLKENIPDYDANKSLPTLEEFNEQLDKQIAQTSETDAKHKEALIELANIQLNIENIEEDGTYTEKLQAFENEKAVAQHLTDEWISNKLAAGIIKETLNRITEDRFREIILDAQDYFTLLTDGEYEQIIFKDDVLFVQHHQGNVVDVQELSRGTAEPLYVAIRLAYIKNTQDMMELPIIMDDPFVNFDPQRVDNMYRLLQKLSGHLQIIYFSFDPRALEYFDGNQVKRL
jgi:uncharacterized protein YhaN